MRKRLFGLVARLRRGARSAKRAALLASALTMGAAVLGAPADLARGLAWLQAQVQAQGALALESQAAARQQARCETATTLLKLAGSSTQVAGLIASLQESASDAATESLACWQQLRQQLGQTILVGDLEARRVSQQGYAPYEGFAVASALDTGWALAAQLRNHSTADKGTLLSWLQSAQAASGSFTTAGREDVLATAAVLRGLKDEASKSAAAAAIAGKAATWLLSQRSAQGNWLDDVASTAIVYEAAHPYTGLDASIGSGVEAYLLSRQQPDGSWQADPYVTAVALRALALTPVAPIDPTLAAAATVRGVVTLAATGEPVAGATLSAQPATGTVRSTVTDAHGRYLMQGITPGAITLTASSGSYQTLTAQVTVPMGGIAVFSPALYPTGATPPTAARIKGRVLAFGSNSALAGTSVQVAGATQASALTDAQGAFDIAVSGGAHTVSYSLAGYATEYQQVSLSGGSVADVGTVLLRAARTTSSMRGVVNDLQGVPLAGATVVLQGGSTAVTNSGGAYSFADLNGLQFGVQPEHHPARRPSTRLQSAEPERGLPEPVGFDAVRAVSRVAQGRHSHRRRDQSVAWRSGGGRHFVRGRSTRRTHRVAGGNGFERACVADLDTATWPAAENLLQVEHRQLRSWKLPIQCPSASARHRKPRQPGWNRRGFVAAALVYCVRAKLRRLCYRESTGLACRNQRPGQAVGADPERRKCFLARAELRVSGDQYQHRPSHIHASRKQRRTGGCATAQPEFFRLDAGQWWQFPRGTHLGFNARCTCDHDAVCRRRRLGQLHRRQILRARRNASCTGFRESDRAERGERNHQRSLGALG
jgi:hypothetical protein